MKKLLKESGSLKDRLTPKSLVANSPLFRIKTCQRFKVERGHRGRCKKRHCDDANKDEPHLLMKDKNSEINVYLIVYILFGLFSFNVHVVSSLVSV